MLSTSVSSSSSLLAVVILIPVFVVSVNAWILVFVVADSLVLLVQCLLAG